MFCLSIRKDLLKCVYFPVRISEHEHRLSRAIVESPSLQILKSRWDMVPDNLL